jgi:hypothetical protein
MSLGAGFWGAVDRGGGEPGIFGGELAEGTGALGEPGCQLFVSRLQGEELDVHATDHLGSLRQ